MKFLIIFHNFVVFSRTLKPREIADGVKLRLPVATSTIESTTTSSITTFTGVASVIELQPFEISADNKNCNESEFRTKPHFGNFMLTSEPPSLCASAEPPTQSTPFKESHRTMTKPLPPWAPRPWSKTPSVDKFTSPCYFYRDGEENPLPCDFFPPDFPDYSTDYYNDFAVMIPPDFMIQPFVTLFFKPESRIIYLLPIIFKSNDQSLLKHLIHIFLALDLEPSLKI